MPGIYQRYTQLVRQTGADITGIGIMTVDNMGHEFIIVEIIEQVISEIIEVIPKLFLWHINLIGTVDTNNINFLTEWFDVIGIITTDRFIINSSGYQIDPCDVRALTQSPRQLNHIFALATSICVPA